MKDSLALKLVMTANHLQQLISQSLVTQLAEEGYKGINASRLSFLGALECGENYASEIARYLNVSRQMVSKTVKELSELGYLEYGKSSGKQKPITFTENGEQLMSSCREQLARLDQSLGKNPNDLNRLVQAMQNLIETVGLKSSE